MTIAECTFFIRFFFISDACGGIIEATNGTITSPSFPDLYPGNKSCIWEIIAPAQFKITLNFTHFDLEGNNVIVSRKISYIQEVDKIM